MTTEGVIACKEELHLTDENGVLTEIVGLQSTSLPNYTVSDVDITDMKSGCTTITRAGLIDLGTVSFTLKHSTGSATDALLEEHFFSKETRPAKIVTEDEAGAMQEVECNAYVQNYARGSEATAGTVRTSTGTLKLTSRPTTTAQ
ncbi:MAG: phage tail tube protein [Litorimonas sp.]